MKIVDEKNKFLEGGRANFVKPDKKYSPQVSGDKCRKAFLPNSDLLAPTGDPDQPM